MIFPDRMYIFPKLIKDKICSYLTINIEIYKISDLYDTCNEDMSKIYIKLDDMEKRNKLYKLNDIIRYYGTIKNKDINNLRFKKNDMWSMSFIIDDSNAIHIERIYGKYQYEIHYAIKHAPNVYTYSNSCNISVYKKEKDMTRINIIDEMY